MHRSSSTHDTARQLAEVTEQYTSLFLDTPRQTPFALQPGTVPAVTAPRAIATPHQEQRDALAVATMARVMARADAQNIASRELFTRHKRMPIIDPGYVATHVCTPLNLPGVGAASSKGTRAYQQDVAVADWDHAQKLPMAAICDGHGREAPGDVTPWHWLRENLISTLRAHLPAPGASTELTPYRVRKALIRAIDGARLRPRYPFSVAEQMPSINAVDNGSTLTAAVRIADAIYLVNVGDSRAVLVRRDGSVQQLTVDHKIDEPEEWKMVQSRVMAGEATVSEQQPGNYRMVRYARSGKAYGVAMSRSIGDDQATLSTPEITMVKVTSNDVALVICSDGIFDTVHNEQVGQYVSAVMARRHHSAAELSQYAAEGLVGWCFDTEVAREKSHASIDNLTALVLPLQQGSQRP